MTADPALVEAIMAELIANGAGVGSSLHSWRCEYPDHYGKCACVEATAEEVAAALEPLILARERAAWDKGEAAGLNNYEKPDDGEFTPNPYGETP